LRTANEPDQRHFVILRDVPMTEVHLADRVECVRRTPFGSAFKPVQSLHAVDRRSQAVAMHDAHLELSFGLTLLGSSGQPVNGGDIVTRNTLDRLPALAADLVQRRVAAIDASGSPNSAQIAKTATDTIPIVFANGGDPLVDGVVDSLNRPGGNITGVTFFSNVLAKKRLGLLRELIPPAARVWDVTRGFGENTWLASLDPLQPSVCLRLPRHLPQMRA
jgi:hypothetical protein